METDDGNAHRLWPGDTVSRISDTALAKRLTGLCTFLVQGHPFEPGDEVDIIFAREATAERDEELWLPLTVTQPGTTRDALGGSQRRWGRQVVLVRARLSRTGGFPRDSMNRPCDEYDPDALSLSDVRVIDRSPPVENTPPSDEREPGR